MNWSYASRCADASDRRAGTMWPEDAVYLVEITEISSNLYGVFRSESDTACYL